MGTVSKALGLLDILSHADARCGLSDVARLSGYDKATTRRLLVELKLNGFVEQDEITRTYQLGPALLMLGRAREDRFPFFKIVEPTVCALAEASGETAHASEYSAGGMTSVYSQQSDKSNRVIVPAGEKLPLHATASGLAYLAASPAAFVETVLNQPLQAFTAASVTNPDALRQIIAQTRARGYSLCNQMREDGVYSVAAAILHPRGTPVGAIAVAMPTSRADPETVNQISALTIAAALDIAARLFGRITAPQKAAKT